MSNEITQAILYVLTPGAVEKLRDTAAVYNDHEWKVISDFMHGSRNAFYVGLALAIIGCVGLLLSEFSSISTFCALTGVGVVTYASRELYELGKLLIQS